MLTMGRRPRSLSTLSNLKGALQTELNDFKRQEAV